MKNKILITVAAAAASALVAYLVKRLRANSHSTESIPGNVNAKNQGGLAHVLD
jgi:hypothetical protein